MYICVHNMDRAINFYENLFNCKVTGKDEIYSVFDINGFRYGLFANKKTGEKKIWGNNCLPSFQVNDIDLILEKLKELNCPIVFPLTNIGKNKVLEFTDCEGNAIEITSPIK